MQSFVRLVALTTALLALVFLTWPVPAARAQEAADEAAVEEPAEADEAELDDEGEFGEGELDDEGEFGEGELDDEGEFGEGELDDEGEFGEGELDDEGESGEGELDDDEEAKLKGWAGIEEITVTASKREQAMQDVPISMSALQSEFIEDSGITEFGQLQQFVPNLKINPTTDTRSTVIRIRGIGSVGSNAGIDPSVGVFIDGVYQGRAGMSVGDLLDIERVEVLRGPQGTLYGKNTAAGAINVHTKRPIYDFESTAEVVVGNYNDRQVRGSINVPLLNDRLAARVSGYRAVRDGFDTNRFDGGDVNDGNKWGGRGRFLIDATPNLEILVSGDYSYESTKCCVADIITYKGPSLMAAIGAGQNATELTWVDEYVAAHDDPDVLDWADITRNDPPDLSIDPWDPRQFTRQPWKKQVYADAQADYIQHIENVDEKYDADPFDRVVGANEDSTNKVEVGGVSLKAELALGDFTVSSLSAYRHYSSDSFWDGDFSAIFDVVYTNTLVDLDQFSQEFQVVSPSGETFEYQGGLYFYFQNMDTWEQMGLKPEDPEALNYNWDLLLDVYNINSNLHRTYSLATYGQGTYNLTDQWSLTGGLRLSWERKTRVGSQLSPNAPDDPAIPDFQKIDAPPIAGPDQFLDNQKDWMNLSGMASLRYFPVDNVMLYTSYSRGFKSGGFNQLRTSEAQRLLRDNTQFDPEYATNLEAGAKTTWWDRRLTLNATFFYTWYQDFQAQLYDGAIISVENAGSMRSYGVEADLVLVPLPDLIVSGSLGWNIAKYKFYPEAENTIVGAFPLMKYNADNCGVSPPPGCQKSTLQNLTGERVDNAPHWTVTAFAQYEKPIPIPGLSVLWNVQAEYSYTSMLFLAPDLDPALKQPPIHLLNLRTGVRAEDELWELTLWVKNVTDEKWLVVGFDTPIVGGFAGVNGPPRQYGATLRFHF